MFLPKNRFTRAAVVILMFAGVIPGCSSRQATFGSTIIGYNHTSNGIFEYFVKLDQGPWVNGMSLMPHSGGGGFVCCIPIPRQWNENMKASLRITEIVSGKQRQREIVVPVPRYDPEYTNYLNVHFLRGGKVKVFALGITMTSANYPLKGAEADLGGSK